MTTTTDLAPIGLQATPEGMIPCAACGIPATGPTTGYYVFTRMIETPKGERPDKMADGVTVELPTCGDCRAIGNLTGRIIAAHPELRRTLGSVAHWRLSTALYALDALDHPLPEPDITPARLGALVHRLADPGVAIMYSRRFSPVWALGATSKHSARTRWSAVDPARIADCRRGAADAIADARPPRPLPHPTGARCDWCGTAKAMGRRTSEAWFGKLCATCAAVKARGDLSHEAVWQAIDADQSIRRRLPYRPDLTGVRPWSQDSGGDGTPWSHLGGIESLREHVARLVSSA